MFITEVQKILIFLTLNCTFYAKNERKMYDFVTFPPLLSNVAIFRRFHPNSTPPRFWLATPM